MKKIVNAIIYCALFISCTNSLSDNKLSEYDIKTQAIEIIEQGYISFQDNQYHLDLDINKAIDLGYSSFTYSKLQATIDEANNIIRTQLNEWQNDPNISEIRISDATYDKNTLDFRMTKSPTMYGTIETIDASPREQTYTLPPVQASHIIANCYARNYPFGVNMVTTIQSGIVQ